MGQTKKLQLTITERKGRDEEEIGAGLLSRVPFEKVEGGH